MGLENLSEIERKTYEFIKEVGEIQISRLPDKKMLGAVATLKNKGLVEVQRKYSSIYRRKKKKFVNVKNTNTPQQ